MSPWSPSDSQALPAAATNLAAVSGKLDPQLKLWLRRIEHVVIEPAGILYDASLWSRWLLALLSRMGWRSGFRAFAQVLRSECLEAVYSGKTSRDQALRRFLRSLGLSTGQAEEVLAASCAWRRNLDNSLRPLPGARKAAIWLKQAGLGLSVLSDSEESAAGMSQRLAKLGFHDCFSTVLTSRDLRCTKSQLQGFQAMQTALRCDHRVLAFVGHDGNDLDAAHAAGWLRVACHHDPSVQAEVRLGRLEELASLVQQSRDLAAAG